MSHRAATFADPETAQRTFSNDNNDVPLSPLSSLDTIQAVDHGVPDFESVPEHRNEEPHVARVNFSDQLETKPAVNEGGSDDEDDDSDASSDTSEDSKESDRAYHSKSKLANKLYKFIWTHASFRAFHVTFFIVLLFVTTALLFVWRRDPTLSFVDGLFVAASAITGASLFTVPMETFNEFQQTVIFLGLIVGCLVFMSLMPVLIRRSYLKSAIAYLEKKREKALQRHAASLRALSDMESGQQPRSAAASNGAANATPNNGAEPGPAQQAQRPSARKFGRSHPTVDLGSLQRRRTMFTPPNWPYLPVSDEKPLSQFVASGVPVRSPAVKWDDPRPLLYQYESHPASGQLVRRKTIAVPDEAARHALERMKRAARRMSAGSLAQLGKIPSAIPELDALNYLIVLILFYTFVPSAIFAGISSIWLAYNPEFRQVVADSGAAASPPNVPPQYSNSYWFAIFAMYSSFANCGMMTISSGATVFLNGNGGPMPYLLIMLTWMGFTLAPVFMRYTTLLVRWIEAKRLGRHGKGDYLGSRRMTIVGREGLKDFMKAGQQKTSRLLNALDFLLEHPRRVYTLMFRPPETHWILIVNIAFVFVGFFIFLVLEWRNNVKLGLDDHSWNFWFAGWFQETQVRNTGFAIFNLAALNPGLILYYIIGMYLAIFPLLLARRKTNVYLEQDLMVEQPSEDYTRRFKRWIGAGDDHRSREERAADIYMLSRLKTQMFSDLTFVIVCIFLIVSIECNRPLNPPIAPFAVIFEVVSGFGNVGLSLGYPGTVTSLSGMFTTASKLIMVVVFMVGRNRGLPDNVDKSVQIPGVSEVVEAAGLWAAMNPDLADFLDKLSDDGEEDEGEGGQTVEQGEVAA